jgi:hypothetical protein
VSTELTETPDAKALAERDAELAAGAVAGIDKQDLVLPAIKPTQSLTREVVDGEVEAGVWFNTVTGEDYGKELEFVIVGYAKGRFYVHNRNEDGERTYVASGDTAPDSWPEEYAGRKFVDIEDAEEVWKKRANDPDDDHEFGKGPPITTTHNYVGFVLSEPGLPARLGLSRTSAPAAKKINTILRFGNRSPWASAIKLSLELREVRNKPFYVAKATQGSQSPPEVIEAAQKLAYEVQQAGAFALDGTEVEDADKGASEKPKTPAGGVAV